MAPVAARHERRCTRNRSQRANLTRRIVALAEKEQVACTHRDHIGAELYFPRQRLHILLKELPQPLLALEGLSAYRTTKSTRGREDQFGNGSCLVSKQGPLSQYCFGPPLAATRFGGCAIQKNVNSRSTTACVGFRHEEVSLFGRYLCNGYSINRYRNYQPISRRPSKQIISLYSGLYGSGLKYMYSLGSS